MLIYVLAAVAIFILLNKLIRLPTVGKYGERYVFITGCDTGFGNQLAKRLDSLGFNVFAGCLTERGADELRKVSSARLKTVSLDVTKIQNIVKAREFVESHLPNNKGLWALVNNAGIACAFANSEMFSREDYERVIAVNLYGMIDVTRTFQPLVRKGKGRFVNITSVAGRIATSCAPYTVSKYGAEAFSDCLRREVYKQGLTVHIIEPGAFKTEILNPQTLRRNLEKTFNNANTEVQEYYGRDFVKKTADMFDGLMSQVSSKTEMVVDAYTHAITARFPRYRYIVGSDTFILRILWTVPEWMSDPLLASYSIQPEGAAR